MRSIGPAVTREQSPAFLRNSNGRLDFPGPTQEASWIPRRNSRMGWDDWMASLMKWPWTWTLGKLQEMVRDREAWHAAARGVTKSQTWLGDWTTISWMWSGMLSWNIYNIHMRREWSGREKGEAWKDSLYLKHVRRKRCEEMEIRAKL